MPHPLPLVEQWGTFDVANYGDLLFPLILKDQLQRRSSAVDILLASPQGGAFISDSSVEVRRIARSDESAFYTQLLSRAGVILGGGDLVRFDDHSMNGIYRSARGGSGALRPFSIFVDDLGRLAQICPVYWNAPGVPFDFTLEQRARVRRGLEHVRYLSVRDGLSRRRLENAGVEREIWVVPDTAFLVSQLFLETDIQEVITRFENLGYFPAGRQVLTLQVSMAYKHLESALGQILSDFTRDFTDVDIVLLPIGICHNDLTLLRKLKDRVGGRAFLVDKEPLPVEVAAVISRSNFFVGFSLHGNVTSCAYGVDHLVLGCVPDIPTKLSEYAKSIDREDCLVRSVADLPAQLRNLARGQYPVNTNIYSTIVKQIDDHFDRLDEFIGSATQPDENLLRQLTSKHEEELRAAGADRHTPQSGPDETWDQRESGVYQEISDLIPPGETFILVDDAQFGWPAKSDFVILPFLERDNLFWGAPPDSQTAITELERLRRSDVNYIVFGWPAFWWLDYYPDFYRHLSSNYSSPRANDSFIIFDLRSNAVQKLSRIEATHFVEDITQY